MTNSINQDVSPEKDPFWIRQFSRECTNPQVIFDVSFGLIIPILCLVFDPIVFKGGVVGRPLLGQYQLFAYAVTAIEVSLLFIFLIFRSRLGAWTRLLGGAFISGAVFSLLTGLVIFPYSVLGLMVFIGILGFVPFFTSFAYLRTGWRALHAGDLMPPSSLIKVLVLGAILSLGFPALLSIYVSRTATEAIETILHGNTQEAEVAIIHLRRLPLIPQQNLELLVRAYMTESDPRKKQILSESYQLLAAEDIQDRVAAILGD